MFPCEWECDAEKYAPSVLSALFLTVTIGLLLAFMSQDSEPPAPTPRLASQNQQQHADPKQADKDNGQSISESAPRGSQGTDGQERTPPDRWGTVPDWIVAAAALIALLIYGTQTKHMDTANKAANATLEQMRLEQRAWISLEEPKIEVPPAVDGNTKIAMKAIFEAKNLGLTPAIISYYCLRSRPFLGRHEPFPSVDLPLGAMFVSTILAPGQTRGFTAYDIEPPEEVWSTVANNEPLYIQFAILYSDVFNREHVTAKNYVYALANHNLTEIGGENRMD